MAPANDCDRIEPRGRRVSDPGTHWTVDDPARLAARIRLRAVQMVRPQGFGYLGQALSSAEQVAALFTVLKPGEDRLVCSPGHYVIGLFAAAAELGLLTEAQARSYGNDGSPIEAIGTERSPVAGALTVLLDANNSQVDGPVDTITTVEPIAAKWESFGWAAVDLDGHDVDAVLKSLTEAGDADQPAVLICRTSTRHGLACLPPDADGHFIKLPEALADAAEAELRAELERVGG